MSFLFLSIGTFAVGCIAQMYYQRKMNYFYIFLPLAYLQIVYWKVGTFQIHMISVALEAILLIQASEKDIQTRTVDDSISVLLLLCAMPFVPISTAIMAMAAVCIPQLIIAVAKPGTYGGADIKVSTAAAAFLGMIPGMIALLIGLILSILWQLFFKPKNNKAIPLVPFITVGILAMIFHFI